MYLKYGQDVPFPIPIVLKSVPQRAAMLANNSEFMCPASGTHRRNWILVDDSSGTAKEDLFYDLIDNSYAFVVMS